MDYCKNPRLNRTHNIPTDTQTGNTMPREKDFAPIAMSTGKATKFYPRPTNSVLKVVPKSKSKKGFETQRSLQVKTLTTDRVTPHTQYFDKLDPSPIMDLRKLNSRTTNLSSATTEARLVTNPSQTELPHPESLRWENIRQKKPFRLFDGLTINCSPSMTVSTNFCTCEAPCKWAARWMSGCRRPIGPAYFMLRELPLSEEMTTQISKDIKRTQPNSPSFQSLHNLRLLQEVL